MKLTLRVLIFLAFVLATSNLSAHARMRAPYEDAQVVDRSELIVVGSIKEDSVVVVPWPHKGDEGRGWDTQATLVIRDVIKGQCHEKELPIVIRYGLDVYCDGKSFDESSFEKPIPLPIPKKSMSIEDTGNSLTGGPPVADDARQDHIWFLRHAGERAQPDDKGFGIVDPEDVQPIALRKYFESYLAADPELLVRAALQVQPEIAARATRYLEHRQIERILKEPDAAVRVERLLPYYHSRIDWGFNEEARDGIIAAGPIAGPYLMGVYEESWGESKVDIIRLWGKIGYKNCVPTLIDLLTRQDQFWAVQNLKAGWWSADADSQQTQYRRDSYDMVYYSVYALSQMPDARAKDAIELTRRRWADIKFENTQIVETCDQALKAIDALPPSPK